MEIHRETRKEDERSSLDLIALLICIGVALTFVAFVPPALDTRSERVRMSLSVHNARAD